MSQPPIDPCNSASDEQPVSGPPDSQPVQPSEVPRIGNDATSSAPSAAGNVQDPSPAATVEADPWAIDEGAFHADRPNVWEVEGAHNAVGTNSQGQLVDGLHGTSTAQSGWYPDSDTDEDGDVFAAAQALDPNPPSAPRPGPAVPFSPPVGVPSRAPAADANNDYDFDATVTAVHSDDEAGNASGNAQGTVDDAAWIAEQRRQTLMILEGRSGHTNGSSKW